MTAKMMITALAVTVLATFTLNPSYTLALPASGSPMGPGVGGQVHAFAFDPADSMVAYAGGDVCGVYKYSFALDKWEPWSAGLGFGDLNMSYYVDDLLVLREADKDTIRDDWEGVYAATWGGIYFRHDDNSSWRLLTSNLTYTGGFAAYAFVNSGSNTTLRIPFSSLAFDAARGRLYAGAGRGRITFGEVGPIRNDRYVNFYPTAIDTLGYAPPLGQQYSVWECDLTQNQSFLPLANSASNGQVRQLTVATYVDSTAGALRTEVICASNSGVIAFSGASNTSQVLWPTPDKGYYEELGKSTDPWGVAVGKNGKLYALMSRSEPNPELDPGVWTFNLAGANRSSVQWHEFGAGTLDSLWNYHGANWAGYVHNSGDDLTELSVERHPGGSDEVFVGASHANGTLGDCGYFRYGPYNDGAVTGWVQIHHTTGATANAPGEVWLVDWRHGAIHEDQLTGDQLGWHRYYPSLRALVPFAVHPTARSRMVGIDYHNPLATVNGGHEWLNLYTRGSVAGGWQQKGLNLLCSRAATFMTNGRFVIGAGDYGVFCATDPGTSDWYLPLHAATTSDSPAFPDARDVEVVRYGDCDEIYMVDEQPTATNPRHCIWARLDGAAEAPWTAISDSLRHGETIAIQDILFVDPSHMYAAIWAAGSSGKSHGYIYEGTRVSGLQWRWRERLDADASQPYNVETRIINRMCLIPGTHKLLLAAKSKSSSPGGVFCVDTSDTVNLWPAPTAWMAENDYNISEDLRRLSRHVTALAVDPAGQYAYAGSSRGDNLEHGRGGLVRFRLGTNGTWVARDILSGDNSHHFAFSPTNYPTASAGSMEAWEYCTNVTDIAIDPGDPAACYAAVNNQSYFDHACGVWRFANGDTTHIWGSAESGGGAMTVDVSPSHTELYIGSVGQEFFRVAIAAMGSAPAVAANAEYPMMRYPGTQGTNVFAVRVAGAPGVEVADVHADGLDLCDLAAGPVTMLDDGVEPDVAAHDGIYTTRWLTTHVGAVTDLTVRVTAVGADANYAISNVHVPVIITAPVPTFAHTSLRPIVIGPDDLATPVAVAIASSVPLFKAILIGSWMGSPYSAEMRDNGLDEDEVAGDGIFTSSLIPVANATGDSLSASIMPLTIYGVQGGHEIKVNWLTNAARFKDVTGSTGDLAAVLTEQPYSGVYFRSDPGDTLSDNVMIVTFDNDGLLGTAQTPQILQMTWPAPNGAPQFVRTTDEWIGLDGLAPGGRGVCYADYDNDGDNDFLLCNPLHGGKLYRNDLSTNGTFSDETTTVFGNDAAYITQAVAAAWGDYNADGFVDLYVASTNYYGSLQDLVMDQFSGGGGGSGGNITCSGRIFRNVRGASLRKTVMAYSDYNNVHLSACWVDLDNDGDLDEVSAKYIGGVILVLENLGFDYAFGDNFLGLLSSGGWAYPSSDPDRFFGANSVTVIDYDHDVYPDLLVTFATHDGNPKVKVLRNNYPVSKVFTPIDITAGTVWNGATVADFDFNGQDDILLHPRGSGIAPALFMADGYSFTSPAYRDLGYALGLRGGATGGGIAVNFDEAKGIDLFLGRGDGTATKAVYHNQGGPSATSAWLEVRLHPNGNSNRSLIGTKVVVEADGRQWRRTVDGGSGRGGQSSNQLLFGLGDVTGNATVSWRFPSGETGSAPSVGVNSIVDVVESQVPVLKPSTHADLEPDYQFAFGPGTTDWIFHWCTTNNKGDINQDEVDVQNVRGYNELDYCSIGIEPDEIRTLGFGDADASFLVYWDGTYWHHEVRWAALPCVNNCQYRFRVRSGAGGQSASSNWRTINTGTFCVVDPQQP